MSAAYAKSLYPAENCFMLDVHELEGPDVSFYLASLDAIAVGTAALVCKDGAAAELKAMFVHPDARGSGVAGALLGRVETDARDRGVDEIVLETGTLHTMARQLYRKHGYREIPLFGQYIGEQFSVCMAKNIH
ncbi:GNAT family N-acetyltransferase [Antrihabitans cavernicola]|uniref:GNAT family N-acetyltransferase n=1 Tax=Antrihabitans cavernicola TaxID=2495913 RepID=A0A5A7S977_9NOCA|nr:GNAT family N-acetyltransferase [Spelaeibacter cavernicola]KAA0021095.1 GNAT family N-acetyltransferase [Spelaeibacter cavernicola]